MKDKIALVTGASKGIGAAIAKKYALLGAEVILVARNIADLEKIDDEIKSAGGKAILVPLDLTEYHKIDELGQVIADRFCRLDILVGNAGILSDLSPVAHIEPSIWDKIFNINLTANYRLIRSFDALLRQSKAGRLIFTTTSCEADPYWGAYSCSKAALEQLVKIYAAENVKTNIKANLVYPGPVATEMLKIAMPGANLNDYKKPEEIIDIFVELADENLQDSGKVFNVSGEENGSNSNKASG